MFLDLPDPVPDPYVIKQNSKKNLDFYFFVTSLWLFISKEWCKCRGTSVPNPHPIPYVVEPFWIRIRRYCTYPRIRIRIRKRKCHGSPTLVFYELCILCGGVTASGGTVSEDPDPDLEFWDLYIFSLRRCIRGRTARSTSAAQAGRQRPYRTIPQTWRWTRRCARCWNK